MITFSGLSRIVDSADHVVYINHLIIEVENNFDVTTLLWGYKDMVLSHDTYLNTWLMIWFISRWIWYMQFFFIYLDFLTANKA